MSVIRRLPWSSLVPARGPHQRRWLARWRPQPPPWWVVPTLSLLVSAQGVNRGIDLIRSPPGRGEIFAYVELLGQDAWGAAILLASLTVVLSVAVIRSVWSVLASHALACGVFSAYAIVLAQGLAQSDDVGGLRFVGAPIVTSIFYYLWTYLLVLGMREQIHNREDGDQ